jgi:hypothetical protein
MPAAAATCPPSLDTKGPEPAPGISASEVQLITAAARRFLHQTDAATPAETMAIISAQVATLRDSHTPTAIGRYNCAKPNGIHWCVPDDK